MLVLVGIGGVGGVGVGVGVGWCWCCVGHMCSIGVRCSTVKQSVQGSHVQYSGSTVPYGEYCYNDCKY